jgi:hypothetical protein
VTVEPVARVLSSLQCSALAQDWCAAASSALRLPRCGTIRNRRRQDAHEDRATPWHNAGKVNRQGVKERSAEGLLPGSRLILGRVVRLKFEIA